jgi:saccharopine dehydrogenase-like NADP-dependent oxidoreductase
VGVGHRGGGEELMKIAVLGGAGMMGCIAVQDLVRSAGVEEVVIADLNQDAARQVAQILNSPKVSLSQVDVRDRDALVSMLRGVDCCLNAVIYYFNLDVMEACLEAGVHYTDLGGLFHTTRKQLQLHDRFKATGTSALLCMGSAPGVPNVQSRYAADRLDTIEYIRIYDGIKPPPADVVAFSYAVPTIVDELTMAPMVYRDGAYVACEPLGEFEDYWFSPPLRLLPMHLSLHSEVATLPVSFARKGIRECFFKINYWGMAPQTIEKIKVLADFGFASQEVVQVGDAAVAPRDLMVALMAGYVPPLESFLEPPERQPPDWAKEIVTEVKGTQGGETVVYRVATLTVKGSLPTGVAPSIAAQWLAEGRIEPGVHPPEIAIEPESFFQALKERGILTKVTASRYI